MKPLLVLIVVFCISALATKVWKGNFRLALSGRIAMSAMLIFTAVAHFLLTKGMEMMLPDFIPFKTALIYLTGIIEIAAAIGLLIPSLRFITAEFLILFFILILPANVHASFKQVNIENGTFGGDGLEYLWFRIPLQILFILWTYLSVRNG